MFGIGKSKEQIDALTRELTAFKADNERLQLRLDEAMQGLQEAGSMEEKVNSRVNAALASMGVTQFAVEQFTASANQSARDIASRWNALEGEAKTEFYRANKAKIQAALLAV